jgi:hypothetical protein
MFPSLPNYRRFAETTIQRIRKNRKRKTDRPARMLFNVLLLAGLWGVPLYARWMILSDLNVIQVLSEEVLGKWEMDNKGHKRILEFTLKQLRLIQNKAITESADYQIVGDALWVSSFKSQPGDHPLPVNQQRYQISIRDHRLIIKPATTGFTRIPENAAWEGPSQLRIIVLPPWQGAISQFQRADNR